MVLRTESLPLGYMEATQARGQLGNDREVKEKAGGTRECITSVP